jgi:hypothetical protein
MSSNTPARRSLPFATQFIAYFPDHVQVHPYILELFRSQDSTKALVVEDAVFCGACTPRPAPLDLPELD